MLWVPSRSEYISLFSKILLPSHNPLLLRFPLPLPIIINSHLTPIQRWRLRGLFIFISKTHRRRITTTSNVSYPQLTLLLLQPFATFCTFKKPNMTKTRRLNENCLHQEKKLFTSRLPSEDFVPSSADQGHHPQKAFF